MGANPMSSFSPSVFLSVFVEPSRRVSAGGAPGMEGGRAAGTAVLLGSAKRRDAHREKRTLADKTASGVRRSAGDLRGGC